EKQDGVLAAADKRDFFKDLVTQVTDSTKKLTSIVGTALNKVESHVTIGSLLPASLPSLVKSIGTKTCYSAGAPKIRERPFGNGASGSLEEAWVLTAYVPTDHVSR
ncbi:hypothetical protein RRG08_013318, partial [Elysia crispata]